MSRKLQVKRGKEANLPTLAEGEFGFLTDKKKLYIGSDSGNIKIPMGDEGLPVVNITSTDGIAYTGELPIEPYVGLTITVVPNKTMVVSEDDSLDYPTLNGVEVIPSNLRQGVVTVYLDKAYININTPLVITYFSMGNTNYWKTNGVGAYSAKDLKGTVPISKGGTGATTKEEALNNLGALASLNGIIDNANITFDNALKKGVYAVNISQANRKTTDPLYGVTNDLWGLVLVIGYNDDWVTQIYTTSEISRNGIMMVRKLENGTWSDHWDTYATTSDLANYLPVKGGTLNGDLGMNDHAIILTDNANFTNGPFHSIMRDNNSIQFHVKNQGKSRLLYFNGNSQDINDALKLWYYDDGQKHSSVFFGEHNTSLLASTIQNLIQNGGLSTLGSAIKVTTQKVTQGKSTGASMSGNGKGKIIIANYNYGKQTIEIDGKQIFAGRLPDSTVQGYEIEFLNSYKVTVTDWSDAYSGQYVEIIAIFY